MTDPLTALAELEAAADAKVVMRQQKERELCIAMFENNQSPDYINRVSGLIVEYREATEAAARNALPALLELVRLHREWVEARADVTFNPNGNIYERTAFALAAWTGGRV